MYIVIWEYQVKTDRLAMFEKTYSASGPWAQLFKKGEGFVDTQLLRDSKNPHRYVTIDRWVSSQDYEVFLAYWKGEYETLDAQCEGYTEKETLLGKWEPIS